MLIGESLQKCPKSKAKDRAIQYYRSFSADIALSRRKEIMPRSDRIRQSWNARVQVGYSAKESSVRRCTVWNGASARYPKHGAMANQRDIFDFVRCRFQARRQMGNVKKAEMQTNQVKENWHAID